FLYFVSHTDKELAEAVRKGRQEEFAAFHLEGEAPDPLAEESFLRSKLQWDLAEQGKHKDILEYYKALIRLRKANPVLKQPTRKNLEVSFDKQLKTLMLKRWNSEQQLVCFMNFSAEKRTIEYAGSLCKKIFDSSNADRLEPQELATQSSNQVSIQPQSILIFSSHV
ncbi:MAG TPA: DUF3459 domain-containing protein, partial [Flavisolibacter sp.]